MARAGSGDICRRFSGPGGDGRLHPVCSGERGEREGGRFPRLPVAAETDQAGSELVGRPGRHGAGRDAANDAAESGGKNKADDSLCSTSWAGA